MKKLVVTIMGISVLGIAGSATANGAPTTTQPPAARNFSLSAEVVNDIAVPLDVLLYAQTQYQGYAVTGASKANRNGQQIYRLQVDRNDKANDGNSFYLLYDIDWKLLGEEKMAQPAQKTEPKKIEQPQQPADKPKDEQERPVTQNNDTTPAQPSVNPETNTEPSQPPTTTDSGTNDTQTPTTTEEGGSPSQRTR